MATCYVPSLEERPLDGIVYSALGNVTSVRVGSDTLKSATGFGHTERAYEALDYWKSMGFRGAPASPAAFFREQLSRMKRRKEIRYRTCATYNHMISNAFVGGWIETMQKGAIRGPLWHYDVNSAYLWAGGLGLPANLRPYQSGDKNWIGVCKIRGASEDLPAPMQRGEHTCLTSEDVLHYGIWCDIVRAVSYDELDFKPQAVLYELADLPYWLFKKITQSYWGVWAARQPIKVQKVVSGEVVKEWQLYNRLQHLIFAQLIASRVTRLVHQEARTGGRLVYVDSVLIDRPIPESDEVGGWKLVESFPQGVFVKAPGVWDRMPDAARRSVNQWYRHAGYAFEN